MVLDSTEISDLASGIFLMTICVSVKVSEGLALAADSTATVQGWLGQPGGQPQILKTYDHARKLSHIKDYPIGTQSWGISLIGSRSVESLIKEFEYSLPSVVEEQEKMKEIRKTRGQIPDDEKFAYSVKEIASGLLKHITVFYDAEFENAPEKPALGILVSGYSSGQFFPEQWGLDIPKSSELIELRPNQNGKPDFGANWFGMTDAINRLHKGLDDRAIVKVSELTKLPQEEILKLFAGLEYPVLFDGMPLQDAVDYATYLVNVVIGRFRFVLGAPVCGGEVDVAVITPNAFTWVQRKSWKVRNHQPSK
jgi:hypothetical protein